MSEDVYGYVEKITAKQSKENDVRAWFLIGCELERLGRDYKSTKLFGEHLKETAFRDMPSSDRSDARWMFNHWRDVLDWLESEIGEAPSDPFRMISELNQSHPSAIRRKVRAFLAR